MGQKIRSIVTFTRTIEVTDLLLSQYELATAAEVVEEMKSEIEEDPWGNTEHEEGQEVTSSVQLIDDGQVEVIEL